MSLRPIGFKISSVNSNQRGSTMKYHSVSVALILAAFVLFLAGISWAGTSFLGALLIVAAAVCEFQFWKRVSRRHHGAAKR